MDFDDGAESVAGSAFGADPVCNALTPDSGGTRSTRARYRASVGSAAPLALSAAGAIAVAILEGRSRCVKWAADVIRSVADVGEILGR